MKSKNVKNNEIEVEFLRLGTGFLVHKRKGGES